MLTADGGGYSRWRDIAVTRWHEDVTRDDWGSTIFMRDLKRGTLWSIAGQPAAGEVPCGDVLFEEDHAEFIRHDTGLTTTMEVIVSGEHNGEVRRICLTNTGRRAREIELTSYAELVLTTPAIDAAHPAFAMMFVETEHLPEFGVPRARAATMPLDDAAERPYLRRALSGEIPLDACAIDAMRVGRRIFSTGRGRTIIRFPARSVRPGTPFR